MKLRQKRILTAYTFLSVPLIFFIVVRFYPMIFSIWMSFTDWNLLSVGKKNFIGLGNYIAIFNDPVFVKALVNTLEYVVLGVPGVIVISLFIALLLNGLKKFQWLYRLLYVMPYITPLVAVSWVWRWLFQPVPLGIINGILMKLGFDSQPFLLSTSQALPSIVVTTIWVNLGYCIVLFLAGLQTVPQEMLEAARIDGATRWQTTRKITIPLLNPIILFLVVMQSISFLRIFTQVYNMSTQATGGPLNSTKPIVLYIYQKAFSSFEMGIASSASVVLLGIIMFITFLQMKVLNKNVQY